MDDERATDRPLDRPSVDQEARWISFNDLATLRGISRASASKLVRRHDWRRQTDNQGRVLILVPAEALNRPSDSPSARPPDGPLVSPSVRPSPTANGQATDSPWDRPSDTAAFETALTAIEAAHANEVAALRAQAEASERAGIAVQELANRLATQLSDASARADAEIATLRDMVGGLRDTIARAEHRAVHAEQRAVEADARVAQAKAQLAELDAKVARLNGAEAEAQDARRAAETLRTSIEELKAGQALMADMHASQLAMAQHDAHEAQQAAAEARQVEEARKGRGRWARLRAAWRGE